MVDIVLVEVLHAAVDLRLVDRASVGVVAVGILTASSIWQQRQQADYFASSVSLDDRVGVAPDQGVQDQLPPHLIGGLFPVRPTTHDPVCRVLVFDLAIVVALGSPVDFQRYLGHVAADHTDALPQRCDLEQHLRSHSQTGRRPAAIAEGVVRSAFG